MLTCYDSTDLIADLKALVEKNVKHFQGDFDVDMKVFFDSLHEKDRDFIWFTRECGTGIAKEKEAYMKGTHANAECITFLGDSTADAYFVHIEGIFDNKLIGSYYPMDAKDLLEEIIKNTVPVHKVSVMPKDKEAFCVPYETYIKEAYGYAKQFGEFKKTYLLEGEDAKTVAQVLVKHKNDREQARSEQMMDDKKIFYYDTSYGEREDVKIDLNMYSENNNLYLGLTYFDKDEDIWDYFGNFTVNVVDLPYLHATLDTNNNNEQCMLKFLTDNGFGKLTGQMIPSGYCRFPVFKFSEETLKEVCPKEFFAYQKAHGRVQTLDDKIKDVREEKEAALKEAGIKKDKDMPQR